jgi:flagellar biosynthesis protein FlhF
MRLKTFQAATMTEAMDLVRQSLGDEAIIVSTYTHRNGGGVEITAAIEQQTEDDFATPEAQALRYGQGNGRLFVPDEDFAGRDEAQIGELIMGALGWHGVPGRVAERLTQAALRVGLDDAVGALAEALDETYRFPGLSTDNRPLILIGPPGSGKTVVAAKLAARCVMERRPVQVISTDVSRAAAGEQLAALCRVMSAPFLEAADARELQYAVGQTPDTSKLIIDTAGVNLHDAAERKALKALIQASGAEPVAVLAAGTDAVECGELAAQAVALGARRYVGTRLDAARRLGALVAAADLGGLAFADVSASAFIGKGFERCDALSMAHRLLADPDARAAVEPEDDMQYFSRKPAAMKAAE